MKHHHGFTDPYLSIVEFGDSFVLNLLPLVGTPLIEI